MDVLTQGTAPREVETSKGGLTEEATLEGALAERVVSLDGERNACVCKSKEIPRLSKHSGYPLGE